MDYRGVAYLAIINDKNEPIFLQSFLSNTENEIEYQIMAYSALDFLEQKCTPTH